MRATSWTRWATCALALSITVPAAADPNARARHKSVGECTAFDQTDKGDDGVEFKITNTCDVPVDCSISWQLVCAPDSRSRRSFHPGASKLSLIADTAQSAEASAAVCGSDGWSLQSINWSCRPDNQ